MDREKSLLRTKAVQRLERDTMTELTYIDIGRETSKIPVRISYRIIELFSEGLYASPHKAIEELVSNAFDAGATNVHVILPHDRTTPEAAIVVIDDGEGMDADGLRKHWFIGVSDKRDLPALPKNRAVPPWSLPAPACPH